MTIRASQSPRREAARRSSPIPRILSGIAIAAAGIAAFILYYSTKSCDQNLTDAGNVVEVCRHLSATDPPMVLLGLVVLVALASFFTEVSGFGITLKREIERANDKSDQAVDLSQRARLASEAGNGIAVDALRTVSEGKIQQLDERSEIRNLANDYNEARAKLRSGQERTAVLSTIVSRMTETFARSNGNFDANDAMKKLDDGGYRVAGYAFAFVFPERVNGEVLTQALLREATPFGQYQALRALRRVLKNPAEAIPDHTRRDLESLLRGLSANSDRAFELRLLLDEVPAAG